jgi:hypothetical protein
LIVTLRRLVLGVVIAFALTAGACILGPKQDDPDNTGPGTGDSGFNVDAASNDGNVPHDTGTGGFDGHADTSPSSDVAGSDAPPGDSAPIPDGDAAGDTTATDTAPGDTGADTLDDGASDGGPIDDGSVE